MIRSVAKVIMPPGPTASTAATIASEKRSRSVQVWARNVRLDRLSADIRYDGTETGTHTVNDVE